MPLPKVRTGRLAPDQEALDYYDTEVKHWTPNSWDQIDMDRLDIGFHTDPTVGGTQAIDRRTSTQYGSGLGANEMRDMRIHLGNELVSNDAGLWDVPEEARRTISNALADHDWELGELFEEEFWPRSMTRESTLTGNKDAIEDTSRMRQWLLDNGFDTISYKNREEGVDAAVDAAMSDESFIKWQTEQKEKIKDLEMQAAEAGRRGDEALEEELDLQANALDDELQYTRNDIQREARANNISHISLNPGNVRSADANFQRDMIGKPDMQGAATPGMLGTLAGLGATGSVLASQSPGENLSQGWEALKGLPQMFLDDAKTATEGLHYGLTGDRIDVPVPQLNEETPLGNALGQDIGNYISGIDLNPFPGEYTVGDAVGDVGGLYNEYVKPHLSERQEAGLGGGALMASLIGVNPLKTAPHLKRKGDADKLQQATVEGGELVAPQKINPEELINRPYVSNMADTSQGDNSVITSIGGVPVNVNRRGGFDFMMQPKNVEEGRLWSSARTPVGNILSAGREAAELPGAEGSPILMPFSMTPGSSSDFADFSADLGVQHAQGALSPSTMQALDRRIRSGTGKMEGDMAPIEDWVGTKNVTPEYLQSLGGRRKAVLRALDDFRKEGALDTSSIRHAVSNREAVENFVPAGLLRMGEMDLDRGAMLYSNHTTYDTGMAGRYLGSLNPGASVLDDPNAMLRSGVNLRQKYGPIRGNTLPSPQGKAMRDSNVIGVLTEPVINDWVKRGVFD